MLSMRGIVKSFGDVRALDAVDFFLAEHQILGLMGENGAGKTTLMNILYGLYRPDSGDILLDGQRVNIESPRDAIHHRIGMVHQKFLQIDSYTVTENIVLGTPVSQQKIGIDLRAAEARVSEFASAFGLDVDPRAPVGNLSVGARQRVEILKALYRQARILVLDEPTSSLTPQEVDGLFESLKTMVQEGLSVVFITHKIREALAVCDRMTVLRGGRHVTTIEHAEASEDGLARAMVGDFSAATRGLLVQKQSDELTAGPVRDPPVLELKSINSVPADGDLAVRDISLTVHHGEIVGIGGVAGNGQRQLLEAILGVHPLAAGRIQLEGRDVTGATTREMLARGVAYTPEDRYNEGILPTSSVAENLLLGHHRSPRYRRGPFLLRRAANRDAEQLIKEFRIRTSGARAPGGSLSGGNIQRVLVARALARTPLLFMAHNPTQGLDVRSIEFVHQRIRMCRDQGTAILFVSEDIDELILLSDRIAVLYRGTIAQVLERQDFDRYRIGRLMAGTESV